MDSNIFFDPAERQAWYAGMSQCARENQRVSLDLARLNPPGSAARRAWIASAASDAMTKRMYLRWMQEGLS